MSRTSLSVLAAAKGEIHVHIEISGIRSGTSFAVSQLLANMAAFERSFGISPASRRDGSGHSWARSQLLKAWREAEALGGAERSAFDTAFANGCVWDVLNDPRGSDAARGKILARVRNGLPAHVRAITDAKGYLCCRILDGEPGDADDAAWVEDKTSIRLEEVVSAGQVVSCGWTAAAAALLPDPYLMAVLGNHRRRF